MKKKICCFIMAVCMLMVSMQGSISAQSESELTKKLKSQTTEEIVKSFYYDYDKDGRYELFAMTGKYYDDDPIDMFLGDIWFVSDNVTKKINSTSDAIAMSGGYEPTVLRNGDQTLFIYNRMWENGQTNTSVCIVNGDNVNKTDFGGYLQFGDGMGWYTTVSLYDCNISKDDFNNGLYISGIGRSWKNYWYFYDYESNRFREYGGVEITEEQFRHFDGADKVLSYIDGDIYNILYRANGIININMIKDTGEYYALSNILVGYDDNKVWTIDDQHTEMSSDYRSPVYSGMYAKALNPDIAVYPEFADPKTAPLSGYDIQLYSDHTSMSALVGEKVVINSVLCDGENRIADADEMSIKIDDESIASLESKQGKDGYTRFELLAKKTGITNITISAHDTDQSIKVPFTVNSRYRNTYTIYNVPESDDGFKTNFYNLNGIYIDNFNKTVKEDGSAVITFDAYNHRYINGIVEIHDAKGMIKNAAIINKAADNGTSIKSSIIDNTINLAHDLYSGDMFSYRQWSGTAGRVPVSLEVDKGGYITITNDPMKSPLLGVINAFDTLMTVNDAKDGVSKWSKALGRDINNEICKELLADASLKMLFEEGSSLGEKLNKKIVQNMMPSAQTIGDYFDTVSQIFSEEKLTPILSGVCESIGYGTLDKIFQSFGGPAGQALTVLFGVATVSNAVVQFCNYSDSFNTGGVVIQVPNDNSLTNGRVTVEGIQFNGDIAMEVEKLNDERLEEFPVMWDRFDDIKYRDAYNITFIKDKEEVQLPGAVSVSIRLSDDMLGGDNIKVYHIDDSGIIQDMNAVRDGDAVKFTTDHFSTYIVTSDQEDSAEGKASSVIMSTIVSILKTISEWLSSVRDAFMNLK